MYLSLKKERIYMLQELMEYYCKTCRQNFEYLCAS